MSDKELNNNWLQAVSGKSGWNNTSHIRKSFFLALNVLILLTVASWGWTGFSYYYSILVPQIQTMTLVGTLILTIVTFGLFRLAKELRALSSEFVKEEKFRETFISLLSSQVSNILRETKDPDYDLHSIVKMALNGISKILNVERVGFWLVEDNGQKMVNQHLFIKSEHVFQTGAELVGTDYPLYFEALADDGAINAHDAINDPRTSEFYESYLEPLGISSMLDVKVKSGAEIFGILCIEHTGEKRYWQSAEISFTNAVADNLSLAFEIAKIKTLEKELIASKVKAETANEAKSQFMANMSHELRTPLNAIIGFSEALIEIPEIGNDKKNRKEYLDFILQSGRLLLTNINDVLDLARIESGTLNCDQEPVSMTKVVSDVISSQAHLVENIKIDVMINSEENNLVAMADSRFAKQACINILNNAIKFTPPDGCISIKIERVNKEVVIQVKDQGPGLTPDELEAAQQPFGLAENVYSRKTAGAGLGIPLAQKFLEAQAGKLSIQSIKNHGTEVSLRFPAVK
jgi:signal transduction histidine kinase